MALPSRRHWIAVLVGLGDQEPGVQVSVLPTFTAPTTFGFAVFLKVVGVGVGVPSSRAVDPREVKAPDAAQEPVGDWMAPPMPGAPKPSLRVDGCRPKARPVGAWFDAN